MDKNYFELICELVCSNERMKKFDAKKNQNALTLKNSDVCYQISYSDEKKQIFLDLVDSQKNVEKSLSSWLLDNSLATTKDAQMIAMDFVDTIVGKEKTVSKQLKKKPDSADESNVTGLFFANRMVNIFPELKEEIQVEKESYTQFRSATFARENILPKIEQLLTLNSENSKIVKLGKLLSELYKNGTLDARSIITMVILNEIKGESCVKTLKNVLSEDLQKSWEFSLKYKGKKVKPEKQKTKKSFFSKALESQQTK